VSGNSHFGSLTVHPDTNIGISPAHGLVADTVAQSDIDQGILSIRLDDFYSTDDIAHPG